MSWLGVAGLLGALSVAAGAFGAHGLRDTVTPERFSAWQTASHYALLHSVVLMALALHASASGRAIGLQAALFTAGIALFSGSIFGLVLFEFRWLGPVTPIGGIFLISGWASLLLLARAS